MFESCPNYNCNHFFNSVATISFLEQEQVKLHLDLIRAQNVGLDWTFFLPRLLSALFVNLNRMIWSNQISSDFIEFRLCCEDWIWITSALINPPPFHTHKLLQPPTPPRPPPPLPFEVSDDQYDRAAFKVNHLLQISPSDQKPTAIPRHWALDLCSQN